MTDTEINVAVAEAHGWKPAYEANKTTFYFPPDSNKWSVPKYCLPNYAGNLNAMHEAEKTLTQEQQEKYAFQLMMHRAWDVLHATARQRAEAFLRTVGKWQNTEVSNRGGSDH